MVEVPTRCRRFEGQAAIITGAARGLGLAIARRLAEEGCDIVIADIQDEKAAQAAATLQSQTGAKVLARGGDLSLPGVADELAKFTYDQFGRIDVLVNNAAALIRRKLIDFDEELMQKAVNWNVWPIVRCCKAVLPYMLKQGYGRIVNIGGEAWRTGLPYHTLLAGVGKGSIVGLTVTLAGETLRDGITVNCVSPGAIESDASGPAVRPSSWTSPEVFEAIAKSTNSSSGMGRNAHPTEVAALVAFFASYEASYVTGQHVGVSGGMAMI
jgi:2,3-dihydroxy-2,3-dihydro-p-cumate dehydrogenase